MPRFSTKFKQRVISPPKYYYAIDTGLAAVNTPTPAPDHGCRLENAVLLHLRRLGESPTFGAMPNDWECDFVTPSLATPCCTRLIPENRTRELRGLLQTSTLPGATQGQPSELLVLTLDQEGELQEQGVEMRGIPAWKWLD